MTCVSLCNTLLCMLHLAVTECVNGRVVFVKRGRRRKKKRKKEEEGVDVNDVKRGEEQEGN